MIHFKQCSCTNWSWNVHIWYLIFFSSLCFLHGPIAITTCKVYHIEFDWSPRLIFGDFPIFHRAVNYRRKHSQNMQLYNEAATFFIWLTYLVNIMGNRLWQLKDNCITGRKHSPRKYIMWKITIFEIMCPSSLY